jgi:glyoxylase-like metal-dependent hydrolase (beta-lactamase superfamily II)
VPRSSHLSRRRFFYVGAAALGAVYVEDDLARYVEADLAEARLHAQTRISTTDLGGVTLLQGAGGNVLALRGTASASEGGGALMIDGGLKANADALIAAVKQATAATRISTLINTHWHPEQVGANEAVGRAGGVIVAHEKTKTVLSNTVYKAIGISGRVPPLPPAGRPSKALRADGSLEFGGQQIDYGYMPAAHTDGDIYLHLPKLNVLAAGGVVSLEEWPLLDYPNGAWLGGRVRALEKLAGVVKPDTKVVPSVGRVMTGADIVRQRDMYQKLYSTMIGYLNMGMGPEDMAQRKPLRGFEAEYGNSDKFAYDALRSMMIAYVPD